MTLSPTPTLPIPVALDDLAVIGAAVTTVAALNAAEDLGVFDRLRSGPTDAAGLARDCAIGERGARLLLSTLISLGLVEATGDGRYALTAAAAYVTHLRSSLSGLGAAIRDDRPLVAADTPGDAQTFYPDIVPLIARFQAAAAARAAGRLAAPALRVLDVGAGAAPWSLALARLCPDCRVTTLDLPAVLASTRRVVAAAGCVEQFTFVAGDIFAMEWEMTGYDLAIAGNLCHLFDETASRRLLARLHEALRLQGRVAIVDVLPNEGLDGPREAALYALGLLLRTTAGRIYPFSTYIGWLRDAGFEAVERIDLGGSPPLSMVVARRL